MTASSQAFGTVELLETILLHLPLAHLLLAQRVDKHWRGVICGSKKIQQALFLEPLCDVKIYLQDTEMYTTKTVTTKSVEWQGKVVVNPLADLFTGRDGTKLLLGGNEYFMPTRESKRGRRSAVHGIQASWRKMALFHPPLDLIDPFCSECGPLPEGREIENNGKLGITIGNVSSYLKGWDLECNGCLGAAIEEQERRQEEMAEMAEIEDDYDMGLDEPSFEPGKLSLMEYFFFDCPGPTVTGWEILSDLAKIRRQAAETKTRGARRTSGEDDSSDEGDDDASGDENDDELEGDEGL